MLLGQGSEMEKYQHQQEQGKHAPEETSKRKKAKQTHQTTPTRHHARQTRRTHKRAASLLELRLGRMHQPQMRFNIDAEAAVPVLVDDAVVEVGEVAEFCPADVADDDVEAAHLGDGVVDECDDGGAVGCVGADCYCCGVGWG